VGGPAHRAWHRAAWWDFIGFFAGAGFFPGFFDDSFFGCVLLAHPTTGVVAAVAALTKTMWLPWCLRLTAQLMDAAMGVSASWAATP
jgi:hypothetical protein